MAPSGNLVGSLFEMRGVHTAAFISMTLGIIVAEAFPRVCHTRNTPTMCVCRTRLTKDTVNLPSRKLQVYRIREASGLPPVRVLIHWWILDEDG